jgi:UDP:flavonoid glycosyltransferase YjiC (YdhE family)
VNVLVCPLCDPGYLYPSIDVGRELRRRGANVQLLGPAKAAQPTAEAALSFLPAEEYGAERSSFLAAHWYRNAHGQHQTILRAARAIQADVLVTSILCHGALLAAEVLDLPVIVIGFAAHIWTYQNATGEPAYPVKRVFRTRNMIHGFEESREQIGLTPRTNGLTGNPLIGTALLLRGDPILERPGAILPDRVHHVGPLTWEPGARPEQLTEITDRLDRVAKPVAYVHLGRFFGKTSAWPRLNAAFTGGPFQAIVELGRTNDPQPAKGADLVVVRKPWMGPLIDRAEFVMTAGTSAPVLQALVRGRPLGVSPVGSENVVLGPACVRAGVATYIPDSTHPAPVEVLRSAWRDDQVRIRAGIVGHSLTKANGSRRAADIIQTTVNGGPVTVSRPERAAPTSSRAYV